MNTSMQNKIYWTLGTVIVVLVIIWISLSAAHRSSAPAPVSGNVTASTSTDSVASTSAMTVTPGSAGSDAGAKLITPKLAYALQIASTTYSQNDVIPMTLGILNLTGDTQTLSFTDGCQGTYNIAGFNMLAHIQCRPDPTSFSIAPHAIATIPLAHYPSVYKIPPGTYTLTANVVGYGGGTATITITQ